MKKRLLPLLAIILCLFLLNACDTDTEASETGSGDTTAAQNDSVNHSSEGDDPMTNEAYLAQMEQALAQGSGDLTYDLDKDGQFTAKDISYYKKFVLKDENEFYLNLDHLRFMSEEITIDGIDMTVMHLYAAPKDRNDFSKGFDYVGDELEGFACVDDTARAVVALAEHYRLYGDKASLKLIEGMLEFVMYMQEEDGDFRNFIAMDTAGGYYKKESASSVKSFSSYATRAYTAYAYAYEALGESNPALSARLKTAMELCAKRIDEKISAAYGSYHRTETGKRMPAWNLISTDCSATAVWALAKHHELFPENETVVSNIYRLGEAIAASSFGSMTEFPWGAIMNNTDVWYEWGSIQPSALAIAGDICGNQEWISLAELAAESFITNMLISGRAYSLTPNKQTYAQINYGTASYVDNLLKLCEITGNETYAKWAGVASTWWTGNNDPGVEMFDQRYGLAFDGITGPESVNFNSGGESIVEAIRTLARILQNEIARDFLYAECTDAVANFIVEAENVSHAGSDADFTPAHIGLNDPALALVKKSADDKGLDESVVQTADTVLPEAVRNGDALEIYDGWQGENAFFVEEAGNHHVRIYESGSLVTDIPIGGEGQLQAGDDIRLTYSAMGQFYVTFQLTVYAIDADGNETKIADDSEISYKSRGWSSQVSTKALSPIPEGSTHLRIRITSESTASKELYGGAYCGFKNLRLYKVESTEIQTSASGYSNTAYVIMESGGEKRFTCEIADAGVYDIYMSVGPISKLNQSVTLTDMTDTSSLADIGLSKSTKIQILRLGRMELSAGEHTFVLSNNGSGSINFDMLLFYPKRTYAEYKLPNGELFVMERDSGDEVIE